MNDLPKKNQSSGRIKNEEKRKVKQIMVKIDGMMCGMCESHINDVIRKNFQVHKVRSSHKKEPVSF